MVLLVRRSYSGAQNFFPKGPHLRRLQPSCYHVFFHDLRVRFKFRRDPLPLLRAISLPSSTGDPFEGSDTVAGISERG